MSKEENGVKTQGVNSFLSQTLVVLVCALFSIGLGSILLMAYYGVPVGDDYLAIKTFSNPHTWLDEFWYSLTHTGRYLQSIASSIVYGLFGRYVAVILPLVVIGWFYVLIYLYGRLASDRLKLSLKSTSLHLITTAVLVLLVSAGSVQDPNNVFLLYQPFYFSSAIVTYTFPTLLYATIFFVYLKFAKNIKRYPKWSLVIFIVTTYLVGLFNETIPATIFGIAIILFAISFISRPSLSWIKGIRVYTITLASTSLLALATMYTSPARIARIAVTGGMQTTDIFSPILTKSTHTVFQYFGVVDVALITILAVVICLHLVSERKLSMLPIKRMLSIGPAIVLAGIVCLFVSTSLLVLGYGPNTDIYPRTFLLTQILFLFGLLISVAGAIALLLRKLPQRHRTVTHTAIIVVALVLLLPTAHLFVKRVSASLASVENYHHVWSAQNDILRHAALTNPTKTIYINNEGAGIGDGFSVQCTSPFSKYTIWLTDGMEAYYGLREICATSDQESMK